MALHFLVETATDVQVGELVILTGAEAHHAAAVRRVRVGEEVTVGDGRGLWAHGVCESVSPKEVAVRLSAREVLARRAPRLVLVQALAKGDRDELAVQASTELGIDEVVPWQAMRSVSRWDAAKAEKGRTRWAGIVREAAKQAHRAWVPEVTQIAKTTDVASRAASAVVLVLEPTATERLSDVVREHAKTDDAEFVLVVGPEGGIDSAELDAFESAGARLVRLGDDVLRTSTAGPAGIAAALVALGRW